MYCVGSTLKISSLRLLANSTYIKLIKTLLYLNIIFFKLPLIYPLIFVNQAFIFYRYDVNFMRFKACLINKHAIKWIFIYICMLCSLSSQLCVLWPFWVLFSMQRYTLVQIVNLHCIIGWNLDGQDNWDDWQHQLRGPLRHQWYPSYHHLYLHLLCSRGRSFKFKINTQFEITKKFL